MIRKWSLASVALAATFGSALVNIDSTAQAQQVVSGNCNNGTAGTACPPGATGGYVGGHAHGAHLATAGAYAHGAVAHVGSSIHAVGGAVQGHVMKYANAAASGSANPNGFGSNVGWVCHSSWGDYWARTQANQTPWHGGYYWMRTGQPTALVVPPTVTMQSNYSWGVSQNTMTPVYHQFGGNPPNGASGGMFRATPYWPTHTDQFGVYPVRGPW